MTEKPDLEALKALDAAATRGPWLQYSHELYSADGHYVGSSHSRQANHDARFIAAARTALPGLVEELEAALKDLDVIHRAAAYCQGKFGGRMSEVDRVFQEITRVSSLYKTRAALKGDQA